MNTKWIISALFVVASTVISCESNDDQLDPQSDVNASELRSTVQQGQWRITYFFDSDKEETNHFTGYVFTFGSDGTVTATDGTMEITGIWSVEDSDSMDDSPDDSSDVDFNLFFASPADFQELSDDWDILEYSSGQIKLIDVSGGDGDTDYLTFERI